jgi:hypothetical protein
MLFVTLLLEKVLIWVRSQTGTTSLRALLYFDEVFGFMPPVAEPPSKRPLITLLKQARAFGLGCVLVTQNPVDIDYKALTNTGTWFIGKLQTERDKKRVLDGLQGIVSQMGRDIKDYSDIIGSLSSRVFLYHNVHEKDPVVFYTRWVMSYLRGPLTRPQIRQLMANRKESTVIGKEQFFSSSEIELNSKHSLDESLSKNPPTLSPEIPQLFFPLKIRESDIEKTLIEELGSKVSLEGFELRYEPIIFGSGIVRFINHKHSINTKIEKSLIIEALEEISFLDWNVAKDSPLGYKDLLNNRDQVSDEVFFELNPKIANNPKEIKKLRKDLNDFLYYNSTLKLKMNNDLDIIKHPEELDRDFQIRLLQRAREKRDEEVDKLKAKYAKKLDKLGNKLDKLEFDLADNEADYNARKREELVGAGESVLSIFLGSRRTSRATTIARRRRMTSKAKRKIEETKGDISRVKNDLSKLEGELKKAVDQIIRKYEDVAENLSIKELKPKRADVKIDLVALVWRPYWIIDYKERGLVRSTIIKY